MAYDESLGRRIRVTLAGQVGLLEKKMFGGVGFLVNGNMACGVHKNNLIVRVGPEKYQAALDSPHASVFDMTGRPMTGWVMVSTPGYATDTELSTWVQQGLDFALSLPPK
jgi:TfoX/Sxy family transcriptional regulator of competence genes